VIHSASNASILAHLSISLSDATPFKDVLIFLQWNVPCSRLLPSNIWCITFITANSIAGTAISHTNTENNVPAIVTIHHITVYLHNHKLTINKCTHIR